MRKYSFYSSCVAVKGFLRVIVYDLQTNNYYFFPKNILQSINDNSISGELEKSLVEQRLIMENKTKSQFSPLSEDRFDPGSLVTNAVIEIKEDSRCKDIVRSLEQIDCLNVQWVFVEEGDLALAKLEELLTVINPSRIKHCEIVIPNKLYSISLLLLNRDIFPELSIIFVYGAPNNYLSQEEGKPTIIFFRERFTYDTNQQIKSIHFFSVNYLLYTESLSFNTYFNRKIFVDANGRIKNSPLALKSFGNLYSPKFRIDKIVSDDRFTALWTVHKEKVSICKLCEFRHMCVDSRIPIKHEGKDRWYHVSECNYNPYIAKWKGEDGYRTLRECGVNVIHKGVRINYSLLQNVLEKIYNINSESITISKTN